MDCSFVDQETYMPYKYIVGEACEPYGYFHFGSIHCFSFLSQRKEKTPDDTDGKEVKDRPFKCEGCDKTFTMKHHLDMHFKFKHGQEVKCGQCSYVAKSENMLKNVYLFVINKKKKCKPKINKGSSVKKSAPPPP